MQLEVDVESSTDLLWPCVSGQVLPPLNRAGGWVQVFAVALDLPVPRVDKLTEILSAAELERARRFHFERDRRRYVVCRGTLRQILAAYQGLSARAVQFKYGPNGKPALANGRMEFNVSHSDELALIAVGTKAALGIDVERVRPLRDAGDLVSRFFSPAENKAFQRLNPGLQPEAFFNLWTRKEAWLKATGEGIAHRLSQVEVSFLPGDPAKLLKVPADLGNDKGWVLLALAPAVGYAGALAVGDGGGNSEVGCWWWRPIED